MDRELAQQRLLHVVEKMQGACQPLVLSFSPCPPCLVAVSKGQPRNVLETYISLGQRVFGENRVQEAMEKWPDIRQGRSDITLHLIGPLQSNKVADAVALFDVIETVDREKIALALAAEMKKQARPLPCLIQVNIGKESQKAGIEPERLPEFLAFCREKVGLEIRGLMCIPPVGEPPAPYFALMLEWKRRLNLDWLSMGMSADYETAIKFGATHIRVGTALFGERV